MSAVQAGIIWENYAIEYLRANKINILHRNFRCKLGEIDLIAQDKEHLVFIEVRYRENALHGSALESITFAKQQKIILAAGYYLQTHSWAQKLYCRFDVLAITGSALSPTVEWIKDAFHE